MNNPPTLWQCFLFTFKECCTNLACATFFLFALLFYSFYYSWPYMTQHPDHIDAVIVDEDQSQLSKKLIMALRATPRIDIKAVIDNRPSAIDSMQAGEVSTIIGIPADFEKNCLHGIPTALSLVTNGAFIVKSRSSIAGASGPLQEVVSLTIAAHLVEHGAPPASIAKQKFQAPVMVIQQMYNTISGYLNFAVPIVFVIIFQTVIVCGIGMLLNDWFCSKKYPIALTWSFRSPIYLMAMFAPFFFIMVFWTFFIEGYSFYWHGINSFVRVDSTILTCLFFSFAVVSLGLLIAMLFKKHRFVIQAVVTSSIPCVFVSGNLFPAQNIPEYIRWISYMIPSTPAVDSMLRSSQAGATVIEIFPYLMHLLALGVFYLVLAYLVARRYRNDPECSLPVEKPIG